MQSFSPSVSQLNTPTPRRDVISPSGCIGFTAEQMDEIIAAFSAWEQSGYAVATGEAYRDLRRKFQFENMRKAL